MKIRSKLAWTYIIILIIGIFTISSYSILAIQAFLLDAGEEDFLRDAQTLSVGISNLDDTNFMESLHKLAIISDYEVAVFDTSGIRFAAFPATSVANHSAYLPDSLLEVLRDPYKSTINLHTAEKLVAYTKLNDTQNPAHFVRISKIKDEFFAAIADIRHIIYAGMLFSTIAVVIISFMFARYISAPIQYLNEAALDIASGNTDRGINIRRSDEFGTLSDSLNKMANTLKEDNEQLKKLNQKQEQFFADITHEVRNPLHTITGTLEMMEMQDIDDEKKKQYLVTAKKQTLRVARLFEDIKTLQRYDQDDSFLNKKEADIKVIALDIVETYQAIAEEKGIQLNIDNAGQTRSMVDIYKMEQVMDNLVSNAIKYSNGGTVNISIKENNDKVSVSISDEGIGIAQEHLDRLFDRFYRTDKARSRDKGGTGLGLAVVKSILSAHHSDIQVSSELGKGSTFSFELERIG